MDRTSLFRTAVVAALASMTCSATIAQITAKPEVFAAAFVEGYVGQAAEKRYPMRLVRLGEVNIASGRVVLADPFALFGADTPLDLHLSPGRYPVDLAVADTGSGGQRVALARLLLSQEQTVRWSMALTAKQDVRTLKGDEIFGFDVDAGTAAFMDAGSAHWLSALAPEKRDALSDGWQARGEAHGRELGMPYQLALTDTVGPGDVAMFSSGWGDGVYASWVGYDASDRPTSIIIDFAVITAVNFPDD